MTTLSRSDKHPDLYEACMRYSRLRSIDLRHSRLLRLIEAGSYSGPALARQLGVSEPTVYRDIEDLKRRGYAVEAVRLSHSWAYQMGNATTPGPEEQRGPSAEPPLVEANVSPSQRNSSRDPSR